MIKLLSEIKPKIPINYDRDDDYLEFKQIKERYSLDFFLRIDKEKEKSIENIIIKNLFLTIKSYVLNKDILINHIFVIFNSHESEKKLNQLSELRLFQIKKWNFYEFEEWFINKHNKDWEYIKNSSYYGFRIWFNKNDSYWRKNEIFPIYPWNKEFENLMYLKTLEKEQFLIKKEQELIEKDIKIQKTIVELIKKNNEKLLTKDKEIADLQSIIEKLKNKK